MKTKLLLISLIIAISNTYSFSQTPEPTQPITKLISWIPLIRDLIKNGVIENAKLSRIDRQLGYAAYDINKISWQKEYLANSISQLKNLNDNDEIEELKPLVDDLIRSIDQLLNRLWDIRSELSQSDQIAIDKIINNISSSFRDRKIIYLKDIRSSFYGSNTSLELIKKEAEQAKKIAQEASVKIKETQLIIKEKLK